MHPDRGKSAGFFNKVMHLVRGHPRPPQPSTAVSDSLSAREVLQESMVRKRRNESIRKHEFSQLRLLRQRNEVGKQAPAAQSAKDDPLSSLLGQETRSSETLQKIDAIEAQMSGQWWRNPAQSAAKADKPAASRKPNSRQLSLLPVLGEDCVVHPVNAHAAPMAAPPSPAPGLAPSHMPTVPAAASVAPVAHSSAAEVQLQGAAWVLKPHPNLEEAAILFAHGDIDGARARLLEQLVQALSADPMDTGLAAVLWHAALDVCRAIGDEEAFEPLAIDYAEHFGRSAPLWNSMPAGLGMAGVLGTQRPSISAQSAPWACPALLTPGVVAAMRQAQAAAPSLWSVSWQRLESIDEVALASFTQLLQDWSEDDGQFVLADAGQLLHLVAQHTVLGERHRAQQWWLLRMAVLRWMRRMDAYEQVALDYCITYEVSPPPWAEPLCLCVVQEEGAVDSAFLQSTVGLSTGRVSSGAAVAAVGEAAVQTVGPSLSGVLEGDPQALLDALAQGVQPGQVLEIACDHLIRLDFVAAGSVLNWAAEMQGRGYTLRFTRLHQLVAVFFCVIGIHEHATVQATVA